ncbi:0819c977-ee78-49e2-9c35-ef58689b288f [Thermothielavioides terrestris]|uniref:Uncharacterized protein n=2 Tax=Thermothielavioides terrestris TaxID=2587410 RepID=G2REE2_THETT|nr:uncharacterized protein THITE_2121086 [Thermothielavioides terrestris NRRL 8126]AEO70114.1 hypothetical protein THITE_2121086 [Thermothielavioides terrestris NRRL 8126]SPQ17911.1 0819c977-ee78-49e2-9c35-ef58689b288f [Thermothielavioides terrestris]
MKGRPVEQLVYEYMFPKPRQSDPQNFQALLQRYLILEVRQETHSFYGHLDTPEAKYPGLDYTHPIHRIRLSRFPWHRRLFRAFDGLRLTHAEISNLTKWEGTKWAKERFEREQGIKIRDTTADGLPNYADPNDPYSAQALGARSAGTEDPVAAEEGNEEEDENEDVEEEESDEELESVGEDLNERLRQRVAMRNISGDHSMPLDEEWENWLKHAIESGELPHVADQIARFPGPHNTLTADDIFPPRMMAAARAGHWEEIPDFLHDMIRQALESGRRPAQTSTITGFSPRPSVRYAGALDTFNTVAVYAQGQQGSRPEFRPPEAIGRRAEQSGNRPQQTAQPGA